MGRRSSRFLVFEDTTYGSFTAAARVPSAGFHWTQPIPYPDPPEITDAMWEALDSGDGESDEWAQELPGEDQRIERILSLEEQLPPGGPWLVENEPAAGSPWGYRYPPLNKADFGQLLVSFSKAKSPEDYLRVANKYGRLGHEPQFEPIRLWEEHTRRVRALMELVRWTKKGDRERLGWVVRWTKGVSAPTIWLGAVVDYLEAQDDKRKYEPVPDGASREILVVRNGRVEVPRDLPWFWKLGPRRIVELDVLLDSSGRERWEYGDVVEPARFYVLDTLNRTVRGHVTTKLMPFASDDLYRLYVVPDCLLATIYLQLQILVSRGKVDFDWKSCEADGCLNFFKPSGNKRYCSQKCRAWGRSQSQRLYRQTDSTLGTEAHTRNSRARESSGGK